MLARLDTLMYCVDLNHLGETATVIVRSRTAIYARHLARRIAVSMELIPDPGRLHVSMRVRPLAARHVMPHDRFTIVARRNTDRDAPSVWQWTCRIEDESGIPVSLPDAIGGRTRADAWQAGAAYIERELIGAEWQHG